ncbi:MAG: nuclear transport factor 2 family protein [Proteobacteria bacterium]|nr:nuclear transport factor 2 family protein [Pseudomonadota bacterium]
MNESADAFALARSLAGPEQAENLRIVEDFFEAVGALDFARAGSFFLEDGLYRDTPVLEADATGPEGVERKLRSGLSRLERFVLRFSAVAASGELVMSERVEDWHFPDGHVASLPVMCVHELRGGRIASWREYWDLPSLTSQLPEGWLGG